MAIRKTHLSWAVRLWVLSTVFVLPFLAYWQIPLWGLLGAGLGLGWKALPEEPEPEAEKLPFHDQYAHRAIPRPQRPQGSEDRP